jgi:hypothetical protein
MANLITQLKPRPDISQSAWNIRFIGETAPSVVERFQSGRVFCWTCCTDDCDHVSEVNKIRPTQAA